MYKYRTQRKSRKKKLENKIFHVTKKKTSGGGNIYQHEL